MSFHLLYRISSSTNHLSITRLHRALQVVIMEHSILRTAIYLDTNGVIIQHCLDAGTVIGDTSPLQLFNPQYW